MMLVIYGPTVTGKTSLALDIAKKYNGGLISADSRQIYKGLDIGTGKTQPNLKVIKGKGFWVVNGIKILGFDIKEPNDKFSSWDFSVYAKIQIDQIKKEGKVPIIVGGTGFYVKTLINGLDTKIKPNMPLRRELSKKSVPDLYQILFKLNKQKASSLNESDRQNPRRLIRAIEIETYVRSGKNSKLSGRSVDDEVVIVGLTGPNDFLYKKADNWLETRLKIGMEKEIKELINNGAKEKWLLALGLEYKWITKIVIGQILRDIAVKRLKGDIHALIRRQKTYFSQFPNITKFDISTTTWKENIYKILEERFAHTK